MKHKTSLPRFLFAMATVASTVCLAYADQPSSTSFIMAKEVINGAGSYTTSTAKELFDSAGEGITGSWASSLHRGGSGFFNEFFIPPPTPTVTATPIRSFEGGEILNAAYVYAAPNPMRGTQGNIFFDLAVPAEVTLKVFTTSNNFVISRHWDSLPAGKNSWIWNTSGMANGVYLLWIKARSAEGKTSVAIKKLALLK